MRENDLTRRRAVAKEARTVAGQKREWAKEARAIAIEKREIADKANPIEPEYDEKTAARLWPELTEAMSSFELIEGAWPEGGPQVKVHACSMDGQPWPLIAFDGMAIVDVEQAGHPQVSELQDRMDAAGGSVTLIPQSESVNEIQLWRVPGLTLAEIVAMAEQPNSAVYPNLMYFPRSGSFVFHPGTGPIERSAGGINVPKPTMPYGAPKRVLTVDTGMVDGDFRFADVSGRHDPYLHTEVVHGHGPAIADLIGALIGIGGPRETDIKTSMLLGIDHSAGAMGQPMYNPAMNVRGFDLVALMATLAQVDANRLDPEVLNFSFGTLQCPDMAGEGDPLFRWLKQRTNVMVAAAAGNHGDVPGMAEVPSWPAAYARPGDLAIELGNVVSVGSLMAPFSPALDTRPSPTLAAAPSPAVATPSSSTLAAAPSPAVATPPSSISAKRPSPTSGAGPTVVAWAQGEGVIVSRPGSSQPVGGYALWTGTSFATPQVAAALACGLTKAQVMQEYSI